MTNCVPVICPVVQEVDPCEDLTDDDIRTAIQNATGPKSALFVPEVHLFRFPLFEFFSNLKSHLYSLPSSKLRYLVLFEHFVNVDLCMYRCLLKYSLEGKLLDC